MSQDLNNSNRLSRRVFAQQVLASGGVFAGFAQSAHSQEIGSTPALATHADLGTLFQSIQTIAEGCDYPLSFLNRDYASVVDYRTTIQQKVHELLHYHPQEVESNPEIVDRWETDTFIRETVLFNTAPHFRIPAYVLLPKKFTGKRPAIVDLHCHAGSFVFGKEKVMPIPKPHPALVQLKKENYDGRSTSEQLVERGYVVISIDRFYFGQRRALFDDTNALGMDVENYTVEQVQKANRRAGQGEATLTKSLFWAGCTWQGIGCWDDMRTVDYLITRPEVDTERIGCLGVSMGGDRTNYLCALDNRIQCAISVGWMAALRPLIKAHVDTHSFSHFLPGLTHSMDLPDLIGAFTPKPLMVLQCSQDGLYTLESMQEACKKIEQIYQKADASDRYRYKFYDHDHRFSKEMQEDAFQWLDRHLKG